MAGGGIGGPFIDAVGDDKSAANLATRRTSPSFGKAKKEPASHSPTANSPPPSPLRQRPAQPGTRQRGWHRSQLAHDPGSVRRPAGDCQNRRSLPSSQATAQAPSNPDWPTPTPKPSSPPMVSSGAAKSWPRHADEALAHLPTIEHVIVLRRAGNDTAMQSGRDQWWHDPHPPIRPRRTGTHRRRRYAHAHLHQRHHRQTQRRSPHPLRFPVKAAQNGLWHRRASRRRHLLDDRHGLDDRSTHVWHDIAGGNGRLSRRLPRLSQPRQTVGVVAKHRIDRLASHPPHSAPSSPMATTSSRPRPLSPLLPASPPPANHGTPTLALAVFVGQGKRPIINYSGGTELPTASSWATPSCP